MKPKKLYLFHFLDHCGDADEPLETKVAGWVLKETDTHYLITTWLAGSDDEEIEMNSDKVAIVKSTLLKRPKKLC